MFQTINLSNAYLYDHQLRQDAKEQYLVIREHISKIKRIALKKITYSDFPEAFDYVDNLFPLSRVKEVDIYKIAARDLERMGYGGIEGFYDRVSKIVVISTVKRSSRPVNRKYHVEAKVSRDEVVVHELCHYCYADLGQRSVSREMVEEFAYGWSVGYLRRKGHSDEYIIKYNFLPHLIGVVYNEATKNILNQIRVSTSEYNAYSRYKKKEFAKIYGRKVFLRAKELAMDMGERLIKLYSKKLEKDVEYINEEEAIEINRFDLLDL